MSPAPRIDPRARREFLDRRRQINAARMNTLFAPGYDDHWGYVNPSHAMFMARFTAMLSTGDEILDAACGTGKYWPLLHRAGVRIVGVDHSQAMLDNARAEDPAVPTHCRPLQDLATIPEFTHRFAGLICIDALENVGPEDWPHTLAALGSTLRPGAPAYITIELPDATEIPEAPDEPDAPLLEGEVLNGGAYHYYPPQAQVARWLDAAGFHTTHTEDRDGYLHLLCTT